MERWAVIVLALLAIAGCGGEKAKEVEPGAADSVTTQPDPAVSPDSTQGGS